MLNRCTKKIGAKRTKLDLARAHELNTKENFGKKGIRIKQSKLFTPLKSAMTLFDENHSVKLIGKNGAKQVHILFIFR